MAIGLNPTEIASAFPVTPPPLLRVEEHELCERTDTKRVLARLSGKPWSEVADPISFQEIEPDVLHWMCALPFDWFSYYLPALMTVAIGSSEPWVHNLRALLVQQLGQSGRHSGRDLALREYLTTALNSAQQRVVTMFVLCVKHRAFDRAS